MSIVDTLVLEAQRAPESVVRETLDFLRFVLARRADAVADKQFLYAAESSLAKEWLTAEEDEAWKDL